MNLYLKALEMYGFKSFADKIRLEFNPGITAIVGPNGSGKSNIADAVRWVLGEQSAKVLRGSKMEDVIFAGSDRRKPLGIAEVSITIDNSSGFLPVDYSEVTITRRVFRSGESEYYLNKTNCRLKDINELLMDTGIGKEGYSIIGQGKIEEILSVKSEDRRHIFEEAAGIVKYKSRKEEAEKKLEDTKQNIIRINDIIEELQFQLIPLKEQAERARRYNELSAKLKTLEVNLYINRLEELKDVLQEYEKNSAEIKSEYEKTKDYIHKLEAEVIEKSKELNAVEGEIYGIQSKMYNYSGEFEKVQAQIERSLEKLKDLKNHISENQKRKEALENKLEDLKKELDNQAAEFEDLITKLNKKELALETKTEELEEIEKSLFEEERWIEDNKGEIIELLNAISEKKNNLVGSQTFLDGLIKRRCNIEEELQKLAKNKKNLKSSLSKNKSRLEHLKELIGKISNTNSDYENEQRKIERLLKDLETEIKDLNIKKNQKESRLELLNEMEQDYMGFNKGVRNLLKEIHKEPHLMKGFCGVIAQLINTEKKYELAIETALGSSLQNVVTDTEEDAKKIIDFLKRKHLGRVTFLPINVIKPKDFGDKENSFKNIRGYIAVAADIVKYDLKYASVIRNLLGRVVVAEDLDAALNIAKKSGFNFKIVTLEGDVINPGGAMTGGSRIKHTYLLGRNREIKEIKKYLQELNVKIDNCEMKKNNLVSKLDSIKSSISANNDKIYELELKFNILQKENQGILKEQQDIEERQHILTKELNQLKQECTDTNSYISSLTSELQFKETESKKLQERVIESQNRLRIKRESREKISQEKTELKIQIASLKQEEVRLTENLKRLEREIEGIKDELNRTKKEIDNSHLLMRVIQENLKNYKKKKNDITNKINTFNKSFDEFNSKKQEYKDEIARINFQIKELNNSLNQLQDKLHKVEMNQTKYQIEAQNLENALWEKYNLNYKDALSFKKEITSKKGSIKEIEDLKSRMKDLGQVNLGAIEEYNRLKERYEFLNKQKMDLIDAQNYLYEVIKEITKKMEIQFVECFKILNNNFNDVFKELFDGGKAMIILDDPENPLESGIEIAAQPPGKKLQNLSLLSGGERALTAIALLFAILKYKPTPFCILDEIEASLDDTNVERFAKYLVKFSKESQFIVITHRKGTMEVAETLYGITMEETATSKLVSVKLEEAS